MKQKKNALSSTLISGPNNDILWEPCWLKQVVKLTDLSLHLNDEMDINLTKYTKNDLKQRNFLQIDLNDNDRMEQELSLKCFLCMQ